MDDTGEAVFIALRDVPTAVAGPSDTCPWMLRPSLAQNCATLRISARTSGLRRMASTEIACFGLVERPRN